MDATLASDHVIRPPWAADAEAFREAGPRTAELSVHGANRGAARLYGSAAMRSSREAERLEKALGRD
jgi:hypothetical protein